MPDSRAASRTSRRRSSLATSATSTTASAARGPERDSSRRSATRTCGPARPRAGGGNEPVLLGAQIDADALDAEQLRHALDGGLERVRERQLRGRLADDGEQRRACARARARASAPRALERKRLRGADAERREQRELRGVRLVAGSEEELEQPDGRLAERQRRRDRRSPPAAAPPDRPRPARARRAPSARARARSRGRRPRRARTTRRAQPAVLARSQTSPTRRADDVRRDAGELGRGVGSLERRGERFTCELERRMGERLGAAVLAGRERAQDERGLTAASSAASRSASVNAGPAR